MPLTKEDLDYLQKQGIDPNDIVELPPDKMSMGRAAVSTLKGHAGGILGGGAATVLGAALAPETGGLSLAIPVIAGLAGGYGGQKLQHAIQSDDTNQSQQEELQQAEEQHPIVSGATDIAASALASGGSFSPKTLLRAGKGLLGREALNAVDETALQQIGKEAVSPEGLQTLAENTANKAALKSVAMQSAINPAIDTGVTLATQGHLPSVGQLAGDVAGGALFAKPSVWSQKLTGHGRAPDEPTPDPTYNYKESDNTGRANEVQYPDATENGSTGNGYYDNLLRLRKQWIADLDKNRQQPGTPIPELAKQTEEPVREGFTVTPEILQKVIDKGATKPVSVQRIFPELNLSNTEAQAILDRAQEFTKHESLQDVQAMKGDDSSRYNEIIERQKQMQKDGTAFKSDGVSLSDEYNRLWQEAENIKNKNGGMPPMKSEGSDFIGDIRDNGAVRGIPVENSSKESHEKLGLFSGWRYKNSSKSVYWDFKPSTEEMTRVEDFLNKKGISDVSHWNAWAPSEKYSNSVSTGDKNQSAIVAPPSVVGHLQSGKATTGSVLEHFAADPTHPFGPLAKHLLETSDKQSLQVPWRLADKDTSAYSYRLGSSRGDNVTMIPQHQGDSRVIMEEAIHSLTSAKLPSDIAMARGQDLHNKIQSYLQNGDNEAVKEILRAYTETAQTLGIHDMLFKDRADVDPMTGIKKGLAGDPQKLAEFGAAYGNHSKEVYYAMGNLSEFIAHAFKNEHFQHLLNEMPSSVNGKSMWQRVIDAVKKLLGVDVNKGNMLERVLNHSNDLIAQDREPSVIDQMRDNLSKYGVQSEEAMKTGSMDKDDSKKGFFKPLEATFSKVDRDSTLLGDAFRRWEARKDQYLGQKNVALSELQKFGRDDVNKVMSLHREAFRNGTPVSNLTPDQQKISNILKGYYGNIADIRREVGVTINGRQAGKNEYYVPDQLNEKAIHLFTQEATSPEAIHAEDSWVNHVFKESEGKLNINEIRQNIQDYIAALGGQSNNYNSVKFGAIRKAQGYGLPESLRETDGIKALDRYGSRAASDLAMYQELETKPQVAASLKLKDPSTGLVAEHPNADPRLAASMNVKNAMKWVTNSFVGTMSQQAPKVNALVRLVNNSLLGPATGLRDTAQMPVFALPYINKFSDLAAALKGIANFRNESTNALATGARKPSIDKVQFNQIVESTDPVASFMNKAATLMRVFQGREAIENFNRDVTFSIGKELAKNNIIGAKAGDKRSIEFLKKFGTLVDTDPTKLKGADLDEVLNQIAKNFTDRNQGTYGGTGLPAGIIESQFAPFLSLQKWSVEKSNVIYEDVVKPFMTGENRLPMITYTLGTLLSGAAIQQLNQLLSGKKSQDPTIGEVAAVPTTKNIVGELASLMQLSSYAGIVGDGMKVLSDVGLYGKTPRSPVSFPTATAAIDLTKKTTDLIEALKNGENPWDVFKQYSIDLMTHNVQAARLIINHTEGKDDAERADKFRDVRVFNQLEGGNNKDFPESNPYLDQKTKEFKKTYDMGEAAKLLPEMIQEAVKKSGGDVYKLQSLLRSMKSNSYQTMPDFESVPTQFLQYLNYLRTTQGDDAANKRLEDYMKQNIVNQAKSSVVP